MKAKRLEHYFTFQFAVIKTIQSVVRCLGCCFFRLLRLTLNR